MKKSSWIFFLSFFVGIMGMNMWYRDSMILYDFNSYGSNRILTGQVSMERYFCHIFFLRCKFWIILMIAEKALPEGLVVNGFGCVLSGMFGGITAIAATTGGISGIFQVLLSLFPHWIFYGVVFYLWMRKRLSSERTMSYSYRVKEQLAQKASDGLYWWIVFVIFLLGIICEGFIQPFFLEKVIKL